MMRLWLPDTQEERYLSNYQVVRCEGCLQSFDLSHIFMYAFSRSNDLASLSVWWWLFQRIVMIVQNAEILSSNRIKPAGTRPPKRLRLKSGKLLNLKAVQLTLYRNQGKNYSTKTVSSSLKEQFLSPSRYWNFSVSFCLSIPLLVCTATM